MNIAIRTKHTHKGRTFEMVFFKSPYRTGGTRLQLGGTWHWHLSVCYENGGSTEVDHGMIDGIFPIFKMRRLLRYRAIYWCHILDKKEAYI